MQPAMSSPVGELGLSSFSQYNDGDVIFERMSRESPQRFAPTAESQQSIRIAGGTGAIIAALADNFRLIIFSSTPK